jgi:hypothetical protein
LVAPQSSIVIGSREIDVLGVDCGFGVLPLPALAVGVANGAFVPLSMWLFESAPVGVPDIPAVGVAAVGRVFPRSGVEPEPAEQPGASKSATPTADTIQEAGEIMEMCMSHCFRAGLCARCHAC